jgi:hypothetical protein
MFLTALIAHLLLFDKSLAMQDEPQISVIKFNWRKLTATDPLASKQTQDVRDAQIKKQYDKNQPNRVEGNRLDLDKLKRAPLETRAQMKSYQYEVEVKNTGSKEVVGVIWEYVFTDPVSGKELVRHRFRSEAKIKPGKKKKLVVYTDEPEPSVVNAQAATTKGRKWKELVMVDSVEYSDGSKWERNGGSSKGGI